MERAKKRALSSSLIQDLREQYSEAPEEIQVIWNFNVVFVLHPTLVCCPFKEFSDHRRKKQLETQKRRTAWVICKTVL